MTRVGRRLSEIGRLFDRERRMGVWEVHARAAEAELAAIRKIISDGRAVQLNMLRGGIAKMTPAEIAHLYRGDEGAEVISEIRRQSPDAAAKAFPPAMSDLSGLLDKLEEISGFAQEDDLLVVRRGAVGNKRQRAAAARALEAYAHAVKAGDAPLYCMDVADEIVEAWLSLAPASSKLAAVLRAALEAAPNGGEL